VSNSTTAGHALNEADSGWLPIEVHIANGMTAGVPYFFLNLNVNNSDESSYSRAVLGLIESTGKAF
jgi:hypothetical protein